LETPLWLEKSLSLVKPWKNGRLKMRQVSKELGNVRNQGEELLDPT